MVINSSKILLEMNSEPITEINVTHKCDMELLRRKSLIIATAKWEYNVKMHHKDTWCEGVDWTELGDE